MCLWGVSPGCHPQDFKSPFSTSLLSVIFLILQVSPGLLLLVVWLEQSPNTQSQGLMYSLRLASWGPSSKSQKPVKAADATVVTPKLPPQVCSIVPGLSMDQRSQTCPVPQKGLSVLWLEGLALELFPAIPMRSCGTQGSLHQEVGEAKVKPGDHHSIALICVSFFLLSLTFRSLPVVAFCSLLPVFHRPHWGGWGGTSSLRLNTT